MTTKERFKWSDIPLNFIENSCITLVEHICITFSITRVSFTKIFESGNFYAIINISIFG